MKQPSLILIGGPNGAGKTTFAREILTSDLKGMRFLNADEIARGLSPFDPAEVAFKAGRLLLRELDEQIRSQDSFALESTLSGRGHAPILRQARDQGYRIVLHFLWLPNPKESIARVKQRVRKGGHHVPSEDIRRRYPRIFENLVHLYLPLAHEWYFWSARSLPPIPLANSATHAIADVDGFLRSK
ncbi:AAA family ATPase [Luteolibacter soli]|uniref:AAA family ATPase n=1 Tax=Luteolibacter soli TaxID=3135280 RepID=A0ABU9B106_9BACT